MVMPVSRGLNTFAPIMSRQGVFGSIRPQPNIGIAPTGSLRNMSRTPMTAQPRPAPMPIPMLKQRMPVAAPNPFAGYTQSAQQQAQGFNLNPNPTAGQGAGQMPVAKQMMPQITPDMLPQVEPFDKNQFAPQITPQMLPQVEPFDNSQFAQPGAAGLDPNIMFGPDANGVVGTGRPVGGSLFNPGSFRMK
jgi:hypothetical protein